MNKTKQLLELAVKRQQDVWPGYKAIADYHDGAYECDFVSPYTKSAHNPDADIMILLQDWSSDNFLSGTFDPETSKWGYSAKLPTNKNLKKLLFRHFNLELPDVYVTNLFPFIKAGAMNASISARDLRKAAIEFAVPQIDIIKPKLVICLGNDVFNAIRKTTGLGSVKTLEEGINNPFIYNQSIIYCQSHTGNLGKNGRNRLNKSQVEEDWSNMASCFNHYDQQLITLEQAKQFSL